MSTQAAEKKGPEIHIGINEDHRRKISQGLSRVLADTYTLYLKSHNYHWNVTGPMFQTLHDMFEEHYSEMASAVDSIAERIRALGFFAPGTFTEFLSLSSVRDEEGVPEAEQMIRNLLEANETVVRTARSVVPDAEKAGDQATLDLLTERLEIHEKTAWMLRSLLR